MLVVTLFGSPFKDLFKEYFKLDVQKDNKHMLDLIHDWILIPKDNKKKVYVGITASNFELIDQAQRSFSYLWYVRAINIVLNSLCVSLDKELDAVV